VQGSAPKPFEPDVDFRDIAQCCEENILIIKEVCDQVDEVASRLDNLVQLYGVRGSLLTAADLLQDAVDTLTRSSTKLSLQIKGIKGE
jgi:hypothetical protein